MTSTLLSCKICTKKPTFSDVSHLLTHISSKGHLAQLHKLQVKSHQELAHGIELAAYNQWYQEHGLAQLLSERLQQKEKKQDSKRVGKKKTVVKLECVSAEPREVPVRQSTRGRGRPRKPQPSVDDGEESAYTTILTEYPLTPLAASSSRHCTIDSVGSSQFEIDPSLIVTPARSNTNTKLKGKIWPGMALFDAASPEEARRRNQKKDASVVKRMERLSRLVQPAEVTFSSEWSPKKSRHIDDLEDASSLIEGESPLMIKPKPKPKRKALGRISANVGRPSKRKIRISPVPRHSRRRGMQNPEPDLPKLPDPGYRGPYSSVHSSINHDSRAVEVDKSPLLPAKEEPKPRFADFTIFEDSPLAPKKMAAHHVSISQSYGGPAPRLSFHTTPWLQPQNQNPLFVDTHHHTYKSGGAVDAAQHMGDGESNGRLQPNGHSHLNPLSWSSPKLEEHDEIQSLRSSFGPFSGYVATMDLPDPFAVAQNPLAEAFAHFSDVGKARHGGYGNVRC